MLSNKTPFWSSRLAFVLAASGSAVGLGNIWRFPYMAGENGGGAFILVYLLFVLLMGLPLLIAEIFVGRRGRSNPADSYRNVAVEFGASRAWRLAGFIAMITALLIVSFYSVIAGWALAYGAEAMNGAFTGGVANVSGIFPSLVQDPWRLLGWHSVFVLLTAGIVSRGVTHGLERAATWLMPALLLMLGVLVALAYYGDYFDQAWQHLFNPDFSRLSPSTVLSALGMAFFSLGIGAGAVMMYGAYLPEGVSIPRLAILVMLTDTAVALLAGLAIFPLIFAFDLPMSEGTGLVFQVLPMAFAQLPNGNLIGLLLFTLLAVAALTSSISLMEPVVVWLMDRSELARGAAVLLVATLAWALGVVSLLSFNLWSDWRPLSWFAPFAELNAFQALEGLTSNILLPVGGLTLAWFVTRFIGRGQLAAELGMSRGIFVAWRVLLQYVVRLAIGLLLLNAIGLLPWLSDIFNLTWF